VGEQGVRTGRLAIVTAVICLSPLLAQARVILPPAVDDMENRATLVCNAVVESITKVGPIGPPTGIYKVRMEARLKILHVFKGSAPKEITYYYGAWGNGEPPNATSFELSTNTRYRFFLVPGTPKGDFTDTQFDAIDELFGIEPLGSDELDDSPPMKREEAIRLATTTLHLNPSELRPNPFPLIFTYPGLGDMKALAKTDGTRTEVYLRDRKGRDYEVSIFGDRSIHVGRVL
jgi:hypothetical protein